jgi:hypothetical protein
MAWIYRSICELIVAIRFCVAKEGLSTAILTEGMINRSNIIYITQTD